MMNGCNRIRGAWLLPGLLAIWLAGLGGGCATNTWDINPLRVGVTADRPPLVMRQDGRLAGLEVEFAVLLGLELGCPVQFVPVRLDDRIDRLLADQIDIIMSGMTITPERKARVAFTEPYMKSGVMAVARTQEAADFAAADDIAGFEGAIGVRAGSRADAFVQAACLQARRVEISGPETAADALQQQQIDLYLDDAHAIVSLASLHESTLSGIWIPLTEEYLAWAVRRTDRNLEAQVNAILRNWKREGRVQAMAAQWFPFAYRLEAPIGVAP